MILYYAMGGGLGHLTRSLAILKNTPELCGKVRLMTASSLMFMVRPLLPCPVDAIDDVILSSKKRYYHFLNTYLTTYKIKVIILDTFPCGIVGEWEHIAKNIPRILIARYLNLDIYLKKIKNQPILHPTHVLSIEPLETAYLDMLKKNSSLIALDAPITLSSIRSSETEKRFKDKWLVVHSGPEIETQALISLAKEKRRLSGNRHITIDTCFQQDKIYPAERIIPQYDVIISGAGYNMVSIAQTRQKKQKFILKPFKRRFDDQLKRQSNFLKGKWLQSKDHGAKQAAEYLSNAVKAVT